MNYYIQGDAAKADKIRAAFEKLGVASNADKYNFKNRAVLYFTAGGMIHITDANGSWANIIKTHPDYKELELPVQPEFKVGDWIVRGEGFVYEPSLITEIRDYYICELLNGERVTYTLNDVHKNFHLWTIEDAKDGDVLYSLDSKQPFIYKVRPQFSQARGYCCINKFGDFAVWNTNKCIICTDKYIPATKEQRDLLFQKMKEDGYEWDERKKELRKIKPHYDIKNFKPYDKVLTRVTEHGHWNVNLFSYYIDDKDERVIARFRCINSLWKQCIPFNDDTKHLLGTTDMCPEEYINW